MSPGARRGVLGSPSIRSLEAATGDPSRIRTCNPRSRNPLLYPVELWDRWRLYTIANMKNPQLRHPRSEPFSLPNRQSCSGGPFWLWPALTECRPPAAVGATERLTTTNVVCDLFAPLFRGHQSVPF